MGNKLVLDTTLGKTELNPDDPVFILVGKSSYYQKKASEVKPGEQAFYDRNHVKTKVSELEEIFMQNDRYATAKGFLFETIIGKSVPKLRSYINRGLHNLVQNNDIDDFDFVFGPRFPRRLNGYHALKNLDPQCLEVHLITPGNNEDINTFVKHYVRLFLNLAADSHTDVRSKKQIEKWVNAKEDTTKETVAPSDWNLFEHLAKLNSKFSKFYQDFIDRNKVDGAEGLETNIYHNYVFYNSIKSRMGKFLKKPSDKKKENDHAGPHDIKSLAPFIRLLEQALVRPIDEQYAAATVLSNKKSKTYGSEQKFSNKGIYTGKPLDIESFEEIKINYYSDFYIISSAFCGLITKYIGDYKNYGDLSREIYFKITSTITTQFADNALDIRKISDRTYSNLPNGIKKDDYRTILDDLINDIESGEIDISLGLKEISCADVGRALCSIARSEPPEYVQLCGANLKLNEGVRGKSKKQIGRQVSELKSKLKSKYKYDYEKDLPTQMDYGEFLESQKHLIQSQSPSESIIQPNKLIQVEMLENTLLLYPQSKINQSLNKFGLRELNQYMHI